MGKPGRPQKPIDLREAEKLCALQCTEQEIADWFHVSVDTLERRLRTERGVGFAEFFTKHRTQGKIALRRNLFKLSEHNAAAAIFMAKNHLGMTDRQETVLSGNESHPVIIKGVDAETKRLIGDVVAGRGTDAAGDAGLP